MSKTNSELLSEVEDAISRVLTGGQDVTFGGKRVTHATLPTLYRVRNDLLAKVAFESATGPSRNYGIIKR